MHFIHLVFISGLIFKVYMKMYTVIQMYNAAAIYILVWVSRNMITILEDRWHQKLKLLLYHTHEN